METAPCDSQTVQQFRQELLDYVSAQTGGYRKLNANAVTAASYSLLASWERPVNGARVVPLLK